MNLNFAMKFFGILYILCFFEQDSYAMDNFLKNFLCCSCGDFETNSEEECLYKIEDKEVYNIEDNFDNVPPEIYNNIYSKITKIRYALKLSMTCKEFAKRCPIFWDKFLEDHGLKKWNFDVPAIKVVYATILFKKGKKEKAAELGLPEAISALATRASKNSINYSFIHPRYNGYSRYPAMK